MKRILLVVLALLVARAVQRDGWRVAEHDLVDHPLMALAPALGLRIHDRDIDDEDGLPRDPCPDEPWLCRWREFGPGRPGLPLRWS